jgi:NADH dehydrogenase ubiquinone Fe-S protein 4
MTVRIYRPTRTATQSGRAATTRWIVEYEPAARREVDPLMGWTSSGDTNRQIRLAFDSEAEAIAFVKKEGLPYRLIEPQERRLHSKAYADNFRYDRVGRWTH